MLAVNAELTNQRASWPASERSGRHQTRLRVRAAAPLSVVSAQTPASQTHAQTWTQFRHGLGPGPQTWPRAGTCRAQSPVAAVVQAVPGRPLPPPVVATRAATTPVTAWCPPGVAALAAAAPRRRPPPPRRARRPPLVHTPDYASCRSCGRAAACPAWVEFWAPFFWPAAVGGAPAPPHAGWRLACCRGRRQRAAAPPPLIYNADGWGCGRGVAGDFGRPFFGRRRSAAPRRRRTPGGALPAVGVGGDVQLLPPPDLQRGRLGLRAWGGRGFWARFFWPAAFGGAPARPHAGWRLACGRGRRQRAAAPPPRSTTRTAGGAGVGRRGIWTRCFFGRRRSAAAGRPGTLVLPPWPLCRPCEHGY